MPLYEYKCEDCDLQFEELVRSSTQKVKCTNCGSEKINKLLSVFAFKSSSGFVSSSSSCAGCASSSCTSCSTTK